MGSALLRRNPNLVKMLAFNTEVVTEQFNGRDSVLTNAEKLARLPGGGTDCSCVLRHLNSTKATDIETVIYISDNESWVNGSSSRNKTGTMKEWSEFKKRNPKAKLVCVDIQPNGTVQAKDRPDILNVGGFSDTVFSVVDLFLRNGLTAGHWADIINKVEI